MVRAIPAETAKEAQELFAGALWDLTVEARRKAFDVGAQYAAEQAAAAGYASPSPSMPGYPPDSVATVIRENWRGPGAADAVADRLESHVRDSARRAVMVAVEDISEQIDNGRKDDFSAVDDWDSDWSDLDEELEREPEYPAWARVLTGSDNCAFCVMLASRGPVYSSAAAAGQMSAAAKWADATGWVNSYHDHCDCQVVMVTERASWEGWAQVRAAERVYDKARKRVDDPDDPAKSILQAIDHVLADSEARGEPVEIPRLAA